MLLLSRVPSGPLNGVVGPARRWVWEKFPPLPHVDRVLDARRGHLLCRCAGPFPLPSSAPPFSPIAMSPSPAPLSTMGLTRAAADGWLVPPRQPVAAKIHSCYPFSSHSVCL